MATERLQDVTVWWHGWTRLDSRRDKPFCYVPNSAYKTYELCMEALYKRFYGQPCTFVALPANETPSHGCLPQAIDRGPPYNVVSACEAVGLFMPIDFPWCHIGYDANWNPLSADECSWCCGCKGKSVLPKLEKYIFTFSDNSKQVYAIAQCVKCGWVHWKFCGNST